MILVHNNIVYTVIRLRNYFDSGRIFRISFLPILVSPRSSKSSSSNLENPAAVTPFSIIYYYEIIIAKILLLIIAIIRTRESTAIFFTNSL